MKSARHLALAAVMLLALSACSKLTQDNYDRLGIGMSYDAAVEILGDPGACDSVGGARSCRWGDEDKYIDAKILGSKIVFLTSHGLD